MSTLAVHPMGIDAEYGFVVRGTQDIDQACLALARHRLDNPLEENTEALLYGLDEASWVRDADDTERAVRLPEVAEVGWFRWNPCSPRSCPGKHRGHLEQVQAPGRGAWQGVRFDW